MTQKHKSNISGKNIKLIRKKNKIKQGDLAAKLQLEGLPITTSTISKIESEDRSVTDKELLAFSRALHVSLDDLVS